MQHGRLDLGTSLISVILNPAVCGMKNPVIKSKFGILRFTQNDNNL